MVEVESRLGRGEANYAVAQGVVKRGGGGRQVTQECSRKCKSECSIGPHQRSRSQEMGEGRKQIARTV
jgi:hypothetical protein